jgi:hypothetical protein
VFWDLETRLETHVRYAAFMLWVSPRFTRKCPLSEQGLAAARAKGKLLGRPTGSRDMVRVLDPYRGQIQAYLRLKIPLRRIRCLLNPQLATPISYPADRYFVRQNPELLILWQAQ